MTDRLNKTSICSVVFLDIIDHSKKSVHDQIEDKAVFNTLINEAIKNVAQNDRIIIDTGDGAAIAYMGEPEDALFTALIIRDGILEHNHNAEQQISVRIGINLGSVRVVKDINGRPNIIGDGINVAERIMSFAGENQILVSRSYYEVTARLTKEITGMFLYSGVKQDKHVREHEVYSIVPKDNTKATLAQLAPNTFKATTGKSTSHRSHQDATQSQSPRFGLLDAGLNTLKQNATAFVQKIKQIKLPQQLASAWLLSSNHPSRSRIKLVAILGLSILFLLGFWFVWQSALNETVNLESSAADTLVEGEVLNPVTERNAEADVLEQLPNSADLVATQRPPVGEKQTRLEVVGVKAKPVNNLGINSKTKEQTSKALVSKEPSKVTSPKTLPVAQSVSVFDEDNAKAVTNKISCSQAQIAMNQCRN